MKVRLNYGLFSVLIFGFLMIGCMTQNQPIRASYSLPDLVGVWEGSYFANQGETGLTLTVWEDNGNYRATFYFFFLPGRTNTSLMSEGQHGSYYMRVTANHSTRRYNLIGTEWINRPGPNWGFVDLEGVVHGDVFSGNAIGLGNRLTFRVVRKQ